MTYFGRPEDLDEPEMTPELRRLADEILPGNVEQLATHEFPFLDGPAHGRRIVTRGAIAWLVPEFEPLHVHYSATERPEDCYIGLRVAIYRLRGNTFDELAYQYERSERR